MRFLALSLRFSCCLIFFDHRCHFPRKIIGVAQYQLSKERNRFVLKAKVAGRPRHVRTPENVAAVRDAVTQSPRRSARKQASALGLSQRSLRRILHEDLKFHPYKMMLVQEMKECDWPNRKKCCEVLFENVVPDDVVLSSDEAHFHLSGCVNKQNFR
ncbi:hypothetical protein AVEN_246997-1 [Araneus ventricosus]|uniref:Uncharacterized protein n=1 Tax=Araneus ventricosus TaxID=182803 RepID=A0A4Y2TL11_ARAVE|nr:hypothetical protein AVEN_246997-1 [Araneus ventricosus]